MRYGQLRCTQELIPRCFGWVEIGLPPWTVFGALQRNVLRGDGQERHRSRKAIET